MIEIGMIRHGEKIRVGENRKPIEESGLTPLQQAKWTEAQERLGLTDAEIAYDALPKIEVLAQRIYNSLPDDALVIFCSTLIPRARMTADLISTELTRLSNIENRNITVAFVWEPEGDAVKPESVSNIPMYPNEVVAAMEKKIKEMDQHGDQSLIEYLKSGNAAKTHPKEDEITFQVINNDLASADSFMKKRAHLLERQLQNLQERYHTEARPVFFFGVGHHSSLIAMDIVFHGRTKYNSVDEMPKPLSLWGSHHTKDTH